MTEAEGKSNGYDRLLSCISSSPANMKKIWIKDETGSVLRRYP